MHRTMRKHYQALAAGLLLVGCMAAHASTATGTITVAGTLVPPPPTCTFGTAPTLNFVGAVPTGGVGTKYLRADAVLSLTCSSGTSYSLSIPTQWSPATVGSASAGVAVYDAESGVEFSAKPRTGTGTGAAQAINIIGYLGGGEWTWQDLNAAVHVGTVSGTVQFIVSY